MMNFNGLLPLETTHAGERWTFHTFIVTGKRLETWQELMTTPGGRARIHFFIINKEKIISGELRCVPMYNAGLKWTYINTNT